MGIEVQIVTTNNQTLSVTKKGHWGTGDNWTAPQSASWGLSKEEIKSLGGKMSFLKFRFKMMINRGSSGATNKSTVSLVTS